MRHASNIVEPYEMTVSPKCTFLSSIYDTETFYIILLFVPFFLFFFFSFRSKCMYVVCIAINTRAGTENIMGIDIHTYVWHGGVGVSRKNNA